MMNLSQIILEYVKVLTWPVILLLGFFFYGDHLLKIMESREIEAFGLKIGSQVEQVSSNYQAELAALRKQIEEGSQGNKTQALLKKLDIIEQNLDKELTQVKASALNQDSSTENLTRKEKVSRYERQGFDALVNRDVVTAIDTFTKAKETWPEYHNVSEILRLLLKNQQELAKENNPKAWQSVFQIILSDYSWGMPAIARKSITGSLSSQ